MCNPFDISLLYVVLGVLVAILGYCLGVYTCLVKDYCGFRKQDYHGQKINIRHRD